MSEFSEKIDKLSKLPENELLRVLVDNLEKENKQLQEENEQLKNEIDIIRQRCIDDEKYMSDYTMIYIGNNTVAKPCLWGSLSDEDKKKPMMLSCNCPKCTPFC